MKLYWREQCPPGTVFARNVHDSNKSIKCLIFFSINFRLLSGAQYLAVSYAAVANQMRIAVRSLVETGFEMEQPFEARELNDQVREGGADGGDRTRMTKAEGF